MNKEEILSKAQNIKRNKPDEMEIQITQKGTSIATYCILISAAILMVVKMIAGQPWYDVYSLCFIGLGTQRLYKGIKLNKKNEITIGIAYCIIAAVFFFGYITELL